MATPQIKKLMYVKSVAQAFACTEKHIYEMISLGKLEAVRIGPRGLRVLKDSVDSYIEENTINPDDYFK